MSSDEDISSPAAEDNDDRMQRLKDAFGSDVSNPEEEEDSPLTNKPKKRSRGVTSSDDEVVKKPPHKKIKAVEDSDDSCDDSEKKTERMPKSKKKNRRMTKRSADESNESDEDQNAKKSSIRAKNKGKEVKEKKGESPSEASADEDVHVKANETEQVHVEEGKNLSSDDDEHGDINKEVAKENDGETTDTSIEDDSEAFKKVKGKKLVKNKKDDESEPKKKKRQSKNEKESEKSDAAAIRLARLKKMVIIAGLRFNYKKLFNGLDKDKQRVKKLEDEMQTKGIRAPFTHETCKAFKLKREEDSELAALASSKIIDVGAGDKVRVTRSLRAAATTSRRPRVATNWSSDEDDDEEVENKSAPLFANLKGIVSDGGESSD